MADLATLELRVSGAPATQTVKDFGNAAEKAGVQATGLEKAAMRQSSQFQSMQNITVASTREMDAFSAMQAEASAHVGEHSLSIGRLERSLASATERIVGMNPQVGLLTASLGKFALGSVEMVAILAAFYALSYAWEKLTEDAKAAGKATEDAIKRLEELRTKQQQGKFGSLKEDRDEAAWQVEITNKQIAALEAKIAVQKTEHVMSMSGGVAFSPGRPEDITELHRLQVYANDQRDLQIHADKEIADIQTKSDDEATAKAAATEKKRVALIIKGYAEQLKAQQDAQKEATREFQEWQKVHPTDPRLFVDKQADADRKKALEELAREVTAINKRVGEDLAKAPIEAEKEALDELAKASEEAWKHDAEAAHKAIEQEAAEQKKATDEMARDFAHAFEEMRTKGVASFRQLFDDIGGMIAKLGEQMIAKDLSRAVMGVMSGSSTAFGSDALGSALAGAQVMLPAIGVGAGVGYGVGSATGSMGKGMASGALSGAAMGFEAAGPWGALIGGVAGLVGGFLGAEHGAKAAAAALLAMQTAQLSVSVTLANWRAQITGLASDQKNAALLSIRMTYLQINAQIEQLEAGKKMEEQRNKDLATAAADYALAMKRAADSITGAFTSAVNAVQGYKLQAAIFGAAAPYGGTTSSGGTTGGAGTTVTLVLDGTVLAKGVIKSAKQIANKKTGTTMNWALVV